MSFIELAEELKNEYKTHVIKTLLIDGGYTTKGDFYKIVNELAKKPEWKWPNINNVHKEISHTIIISSFRTGSLFIMKKKNQINIGQKKIASSDYVKEVNGKIKLIVEADVAGSAIRSMAKESL